MKTVWSRFAANERFFAAVLLLATVALLYGHTLQVPFYLDDAGAILENYRLRDLPATLAHFFHQRGLTNLTFALNFRFTSWALPPLHLTNIALHALCGVLVWLLLRQLVQGCWLPLLGALLFVAHPLQTQAVTYLVQRSAVMGGCLFVAAVHCHRRARTLLATGAGRGSWPYLRWHGGAVLLGAAAILAKEHTVILPLLLLAHDRLFPLPSRRTLRQGMVDYLPFVSMTLVVGGTVVMFLLSTGEVSHLTSSFFSPGYNYPLHYLVTQFSVFWIYLRLLVLPYGQALDHSLPLATELLNWKNAAALAGLLGGGWLIWRLRERRPLVAFGAVWFVLGLAVESSVILLDPLFEHRLYLPMFGFVLILLDGVPALLGERRAWIALMLVLLLWMPLTWRRNALWSEPLRFNEQNLSVAPNGVRVLLALIFDYRDAGRTVDAIRSAQRLLQVNPQFGVAYEELALLYAHRGEPEKALETVEKGIRHLPGNPGVYKAGAKIYLGLGQAEEAIRFLQRGVAAAPDHSGMLDHLAALNFELGQLSEAEANYRKSLQLSDKVAATHRNLAKVLYSKGRMAEALEQVKIALQLEPGNPDAWEGLGMSALALGDFQTARAAAEKLERLEGEAARHLREALAAAGVR